MFVVTEAEATAIRTVYEQEGELSAAIEVRRLFPAIEDMEDARACARALADWRPTTLPPVPPKPRVRPRPRGGR